MGYKEKMKWAARLLGRRSQETRKLIKWGPKGQETSVDDFVLMWEGNKQNVDDKLHDAAKKSSKKKRKVNPLSQPKPKNTGKGKSKTNAKVKVGDESEENGGNELLCDRMDTADHHSIQLEERP